MNRVFMISSSECKGPSGGGQGGIFRLFIANEKFHMLSNSYFIFRDRVLCEGDDVGDYASIQKPSSPSKWKVRVRKLPFMSEISGLIEKYRRLEEYRDICVWLDNLNSKFIFDNDDIFILHDIASTYCFTNKYQFNKVVEVFHMQGSPYTEWRAFRSYDSLIYKKFITNVFLSGIDKISLLGFPAKGAKESLISSDNALSDCINSKDLVFLNSGIDCPNAKNLPNNKYKELLENFYGLRFSTVATLNESKAVERIPGFLGDLKKRNIDFKWILVGSGVKDKDVRIEIEKNGIKDNVIWIDEYIPHDDILAIMSSTDFYILFHKYAIFDLCTLEAMHYGNIPILTPVGGNKEVVIEKNGLLINDYTKADEFLSFIAENDIKTLKESNTLIQERLFNDSAFLNRYKDLCDRLYTRRDGE